MLLAIIPRFTSRLQNMPGWLQLIFACLMGALLGLSAPGAGLWWLGWICLAPAFYALLHLQKVRSILLYSFAFGASFHAVYLCWVTSLHPMTWLGLSNIQSLLISLSTWGLLIISGGFGFAILGLLLFGIQKVLSLKWLPLPIQFMLILIAFPLVWAKFFDIYQINALWIPWALLDYTQLSLEPIRRLVSFTGNAHSVAWLMVSANLLIALWLKLLLKKENNTKSFVPTAGVLGITTLLLIGSLFALSTQPAISPKGLPISTTVYQGGIDIGTIKGGRQLELASQNAYIIPIRNLKIPENNLLVLPEEGIVPEWVNLDKPFEGKTFKQLHQIATQKRVAIVTGLGAYKEVTDKVTLGYNATSLILPETEHRPQFYRKNRLVPFGENVPYLSDLMTNQEINYLLEQLKIPYQFVFSHGQGLPPLNILGFKKKPVKLGALICFELLYPDLVKTYEYEGVDMLVNSSNLGWFHNNQWMAEQFIAIGQARALESHLPLAISANTSPSAIILQDGSVVKRLVNSSSSRGSIFYPSATGKSLPQSMDSNVSLP